MRTQSIISLCAYIVAAVTITLRAIGLIGFFVGLFFAQRLYRNMMKDK